MTSARSHVTSALFVVDSAVRSQLPVHARDMLMLLGCVSFLETGGGDGAGAPLLIGAGVRGAPLRSFALMISSARVVFFFIINPAGRIGPENQIKELLRGAVARGNAQVRRFVQVLEKFTGVFLLELLNSGCNANWVSLINPSSSLT